MNKPQYLAELNQLLIFMTRSDREQTLERCGALFDKAGPGGEESLLSRLGSPTRLAIRMSRTYEPGQAEDALLAELEAEAAQAQPAPAPAPAEQKPAAGPLIEDELPEFDLPDLPDIEPPAHAAGEGGVSRSASAPEDSGEQSPGPEDAPPEEASAAGEDDAEEDDDGYAELWGQRPQPEEGPDEDEDGEEYDESGEPYPDDVPAPVEYAIERVIPLWAGVPLFILSLIVLVVPVTCVGIVLIPVFLLPGAAVLLGAFLAAVGGLWCISIIADAAVLFGLALILLALGLIVLWWGLWLDVNMTGVYIRAVRGLSHLTLGRKVIVHAQ